MKTALVLSAGGMFGAYQAGAWSVLADRLQPDLIVGASIGAINGWAIAGGCSPADLIERWLTLDCAQTYRLRFPRAIHGGILDCRPLKAMIEEMYHRFRPRIDYATVITELRHLQPTIVPGDRVTAETLKATTAIFGIFEQVRIDNKIYTDGGTLGAVPLWAAAELGATRIVAVDAFVSQPSFIPKLFVRTVRALSRHLPAKPENIEVIRIAPPACLGSGRDMLLWSRDRAEQWIERGRRDALAAYVT